MPNPAKLVTMIAASSPAEAQLSPEEKAVINGDLSFAIAPTVNPLIQEIDCDDDSDDEQSMVNAINEQEKLVAACKGISPNVQLLSSRKNAQANKKKASKENRRLKKAISRVNAVHQDIVDGKIVLPDPGTDNIWALHDSGSSIMVANHEDQFPGAELDENSPGSKYLAANNEYVSSTGKFDVPFSSENCHKRQLTFKNAPVAMPIVSTHGWNSLGFRTVTDEHFGLTIQKASGEKDPLLVQNGVYFMKMRVARSLTRKPASPTSSRPPAPISSSSGPSLPIPAPIPHSQRPRDKPAKGFAAPGP